MKKNNLVYYIMTYVMYLYPPFIYGMIMINFEDGLTDKAIWIWGLIVNVIFMIVTTLVLYILAIKKKIPKIKKDEKNHFIFGYIGNLCVYLYVYQYLMNIERLVSIFSLVLILVLVYKYLISNEITFKEIFIFSIVFSVIDYVIIISSGNTLFSEASSFSDLESVIFQLLFIGALLFSIGLYGYKVYKNHQWTILRYVMIGFLVLFLIIIYSRGDRQLEELMMTILILAIFSWLIDIILRLIRKEFKVYDLVYYARIIMLTVILLFIKEWELYLLPRFRLNYMFLLIAIFYVTSFSDIGMHIAPKKVKEIDLNLSIEEYLKSLYKPIISRYKDVLVFSKEKDLPHDLSKLGRNIIVKNNYKELENIDDNALSLVIVYSNNIDEINNIVSNMTNIRVCVISSDVLESKTFKTSFSDYEYSVYTL